MVDLSTLTIDQAVDLLAKCVMALAVVRVVLVKVEGLLAIWIHRTPESRFWDFWARLMQTFDYLSLSLPRDPAAIRALFNREQAMKKEADDVRP